jgi:hypothetical protein
VSKCLKAIRQSNIRSYIEIPETGRKRKGRLSIMYQKHKGLAMNSENLVKIYVIENKIVSLSHGGRSSGKKGSSVEFVGKAR